MKILFVVYDNENQNSNFPLGIAYLSSYLRRKGNEVEIFNQDVYHYTEEQLTKHLDENDFDVVGIGVIGGYWQYKKLLKICEAIRKSKKETTLILGGHGPSPESKYFIEKTTADFIVIGEGEETIVELTELLKLTKNKDDVRFERLKGVAFKRSNNIFLQTSRRQTIKPVDSILFPAWDLFPIDHYVTFAKEPGMIATDRCFPMLSGRGCPYTCNFCYRLNPGFCVRSKESIVEEMIYLKLNYSINAVDFNDELLMSSKQRTIELCEYFISKKLNMKWGCNGRLNFATKEVLSLMKKAGCVWINYGIECPDDRILELMNKHLTVKEIESGIENTLDIGIHPGLNVIFGNIGENITTLKKSVDFLKKYSDATQFRTIRPVTPYPGTDLYYLAIKEGKLKDCQDFYENKHLNSDLLTINFTEISEEEIYKGLKIANYELIEDYFTKNMKKSQEKLLNFYHTKDVNFRGFR